MRSCKCHDRQLQDLHRLDHAGCKHLLLHHPQFLAEGKSHGRSALILASLRLARLREPSDIAIQTLESDVSKLLPAGQGVGQNLLIGKF